MPKLPSGLELLLDMSEIMEPDLNWFRAPQGHFWYWRAADENPPPFAPDDDYLRQPQSAPVPSSREDMKKFVRVIVKEPDGGYFWEGDYLAEFPFVRDLAKEDLEAWRAWLDRPQLNAFLDQGIEKCRLQAEINQGATGVAVMQDAIENESGRVTGLKVIDNPLKSSH